MSNLPRTDPATANLPKTEPTEANLPKTEPTEANLPATSTKANAESTATSTVVARTGPGDRLASNERKVDQYGPQWVEHVTGGGALRSGNVLIG